VGSALASRRGGTYGAAMGRAALAAGHLRMELAARDNQVRR
jgi:hypothetical protein